MRWLKDGIQVQAPTIPYCEVGTNLDFTLTLEIEATDEALSEAYLYVSAEHAELIAAKKHADATYLDIMGPLNITCTIGAIAPGDSIDIDFRINPAEANEGYNIPQIHVGNAEYHL